MVVRSFVLAVLVLLCAPLVARAQGIDCAKARTAPERAICASPALAALDAQIGAAYAAAVARQPDQATALRQQALTWLRSRDAACAVSSGQIERCLAGQMTARLAALAPPPPAAEVTTEAAPPPPEPTVPPAPAAPAAQIEPQRFRAAREAAATLRVTSPGRFTIAAHSRSGVALQVVDMLAGPMDRVGEAGAGDGRADVLLDVGTYRVRSFAAAGADEEVELAVTPFHDAAPAQALPPPGETRASALRDGEQRSFWLVVPPSGRVQLEAAGRALADLRLWRAGRDLSALVPGVRTIEPQPGHPLLGLRLEGTVEPGPYLAVAYGGPALPWTDGAAESPFLLRTGVSAALAEGWAGGRIGPFGSERYTLPPTAGSVRLDLPQAAEAALVVGAERRSLTRSSREPSVRLAAPAPGAAAVAEVQGQAGQPFTLRTMDRPTGATLRPGAYWVAALAVGAGGDEVPPTILLERTDPQDPARIVAGSMPRLAPGAPWRGRFNLRGPTALLFEDAAGGPLSIRTTGLGVRTTIGPDVRVDVPADRAIFRLAPLEGQGAVDVTIGPAPPAGRAAALPELSPPWPADPVVPLGVQILGPRQSFRLSAQSGPGLVTGLLARPTPVALAEGPLSISQVAGGPAITVPVRIAEGGRLVAQEAGGGPVTLTVAGEAVTIPAADHPRTVVLAWRTPPVPRPDIAPPPPERDDVTLRPERGDATLRPERGDATLRPERGDATLRPGVPVPFDLGRDGRRSFALEMPEGGLMRVETTGRLRTAGTLATAFLPELDRAEANGSGQNMLMQTFLRAGRYRVAVQVKDSAGHGAVRVGPAPLLTGATLIPGGSVRATLPGGTGIAVPLLVAEEGEYRLDLLGLDRPFTARLEDGEGWPLTVSGDLDGTTHTLHPGPYRLLVSPDAVARQVVAGLVSLRTPPPPEGHGPHALPFEQTVTATWREPAARDAPRTPDVWTFRLAGPADVTLTLGAGMTADLRPGADAAERPLARIAGAWTGRLEAGAYRIEAASLGRNDRLDYTLDLRSTQIQPGTPRSVSLPATVPFAIATPRVVSLTSWGRLPVKAVLLRADGTELLRTGPRADDWNIGLSRPLPAGAYRIRLESAVPSSSSPTTTSGEPGSTNADPDDGAESGSGTAASADDAPQSDAPARTGDAAAAPDGDAAAKDGDATPTTELRLALPEPAAAAPPDDAVATLDGAHVHTVALPAAPAGALLLAEARSDAAAVVALERQVGDDWAVVALDDGLAPHAAVMAGEGEAWRLRAWSVDGGPAPIRLAWRLRDDAPQAGPGVTLTASDGMGLAAARVSAPAGLAMVEGATAVAGWAGHAAVAVEDRLAILQQPGAWLLGPPGAASLAPARMEPGAPRIVRVPAGGVLTLPASGLLLWVAESGEGQPVLTGTPAALAPGSAVALADGPVTLRDGTATAEGLGDMAGTAGAMTVTLRLLPLPDTAPVAWAPGFAVTLPAHGALRVALPEARALTATLPRGIALLGPAEAPSGVWAGDAAVTRTLAMQGEALLLNTTDAAAPLGLAFVPGAQDPALRPGALVKRFFGAAGSFERAVAAGGRLEVAGDAALSWTGDDGQVRRGRAVAAAGPGRVVVTHGVGAVALAVSAPGVPAWPEPAVVAAPLPGRLDLSGPAMALELTPAPDGPVLLHATTTAPVLLGLGDAAPELFAAGAEFHRAVPGGPLRLRLVSPHDGDLAGTLALSAEPIRPVKDGLGEAVAVAPGQGAAFGFRLAAAATVGVGVRADPDRVSVRLLDAAGTVLGEGVAQMRRLPPGRYVVEARVPPDAPPSQVRPAVVGIAPRGNGPPPEIVKDYLALVGLTPTEPPR